MPPACFLNAPTPPLAQVRQNNKVAAHAADIIHLIRVIAIQIDDCEAVTLVPSSRHSRCGRLLKMCHRHIFFTHRPQGEGFSNRTNTAHNLFLRQHGYDGTDIIQLPRAPFVRCKTEHAERVNPFPTWCSRNQCRRAKALPAPCRGRVLTGPLSLFLTQYILNADFMCPLYRSYSQSINVSGGSRPAPTRAGGSFRSGNSNYCLQNLNAKCPPRRVAEASLAPTRAGGNHRILCCVCTPQLSTVN